VRRLDPRAPLVVDTRELGRRPGSMRTVTRTVPAPADLGIVVIGILEGSPIDLDLRLESVVEGVLVSGTAQARAIGECVRCLDPVDLPVEVDLQELYDYPDPHQGSRPRSAPVHPAAEDDEHDLHQVEDDLIDLEPVLRDSAVLALPLQPLCRDDCPGLCSECGARLADDPEHHHDSIDPRWAALTDLHASDLHASTQEES
jgi:uncharacterized protein